MTYDFIIAGGGSAGCVLANRLSEDPANKVLLVEAGSARRSIFVSMPTANGFIFGKRAYDWGFRTEPQAEMSGRQVYWPRGRRLGGSSAINGMVYIRGNPSDYDGWRQLGLDGWSYADVLPYFKRMEDSHRGDNDFHGTGGPLRTSYAGGAAPIDLAFLEAAKQAGYKRNADFNGARQDGFGTYDVSVSGGRRSDAASAYIRPVLHRKNLTVMSDTFCEQIVLDKGRAVGLKLRRNGRAEEVRGGEVIVALGAITSPQLLMVSGIGPAEALREHGIASVRDLPEVGANLQDHTCIQLMFRCTKPITVNDIANSLARRICVGLQYALTRKGYLAETGIYVGGFARSDENQDRPDIQMAMAAWSVVERTAKGARQHPFSGFSFSPEHVNPDARGAVTLRSADPAAPPRIAFNFFQSEYDIRAMTFGIRLVRRISEQPAMQPYIASELQPGKDVRSDAEILQFIRDKAGSDIHAVGTCRMGADAGAVVDARLRLNGVSGLRVVDASIMPRVVRGNTHAAVVMIAEKGADMILADARR